jgi:hypothetical protein
LPRLASASLFAFIFYYFLSVCSSCSTGGAWIYLLLFSTIYNEMGKKMIFCKIKKRPTTNQMIGGIGHTRTWPDPCLGGRPNRLNQTKSDIIHKRSGWRGPVKHAVIQCLL